MDTLYIGDIPKDYKYSVITNDYIRLYNQPYGHNNTLHYYQIYNTNNGWFYSQGETTFSQYTTQYFQEINVSDNWLYRSDIDKIFIVCFIIFFMFLFTFNLVTSSIKRGGVFGGLIS